jgi:hypothetical protein
MTNMCEQMYANLLAAFAEKENRSLAVVDPVDVLQLLASSG